MRLQWDIVHSGNSKCLCFFIVSSQMVTWCICDEKRIKDVAKYQTIYRKITQAYHTNIDEMIYLNTTIHIAININPVPFPEKDKA